MNLNLDKEKKRVLAQGFCLCIFSCFLFFFVLFGWLVGWLLVAWVFLFLFCCFVDNFPLFICLLSFFDLRAESFLLPTVPTAAFFVASSRVPRTVRA